MDKSSDLVYQDIFLKMDKRIEDINNKIELDNYKLEKIKRNNPTQDPNDEARGEFTKLKEVMPIGDILNSLFHYMEKMNIDIYYEEVDLAFMRHIHRYIISNYFDRKLSQEDFIHTYNIMCFIKSIEEKDTKLTERSYKAMCKMKNSILKRPLEE